MLFWGKIEYICFVFLKTSPICVCSRTLLPKKVLYVFVSKMIPFQYNFLVFNCLLSICSGIFLHFWPVCFLENWKRFPYNNYETYRNLSATRREFFYGKNTFIRSSFQTDPEPGAQLRPAAGHGPRDPRQRCGGHHAVPQAQCQLADGWGPVRCLLLE